MKPYAKEETQKMAGQYTAQEMREMADNLDSVYVAPECEDKKKQYGYLSISGMMLRQAADAMEREEKREKREKKYEFATMTNDGWVGRLHFDIVELIDDTLSDGDKIVRREIGEWEEMKDGE